jgi:hypothetical protein
VSDRALEKRLLLERVQTSRELLRLEVEAVSTRLSPARAMLKLGSGLVPSLLPLAASTAGRGAGKLGFSCVAGVAALLPVVLAVARIVSSRPRAKVPAAKAGTAEDAPGADPVAADTESAASAAAEDAGDRA